MESPASSSPAPQACRVLSLAEARDVHQPAHILVRAGAGSPLHWPRTTSTNTCAHAWASPAPPRWPSAAARTAIAAHLEALCPPGGDAARRRARVRSRRTSRERCAGPVSCLENPPTQEKSLRPSAGYRPSSRAMEASGRRNGSTFRFLQGGETILDTMCNATGRTICRRRFGREPGCKARTSSS